MWNLWHKATRYHKLPSEVFDPHEEYDPIARWALDNAVTHFGTLVENMLLERKEIGSGATKEYVPRFKLSELLDPEYVFPKPPSEEEEMQGMAGIDGLIYDEVG